MSTAAASEADTVADSTSGSASEEQSENIDRTNPKLIWPNDPHFQDFPRHLPDDTVEYQLYVLDGHKALPRAKLRSRLLEIQKAADKLHRELTTGYIWQSQGFALEFNSSSTEDNPANEEVTLHLHGQTSFGDATADEWLVVYIVQQISSQLDDVWARVTDNDGELLLIEAAHVLPSWVEPDVASHRVWMHSGQMIVIPREHRVGLSASQASQQGRSAAAGGGMEGSITLAQALEYLQKHASDPTKFPVIHSRQVEEKAYERLRRYPGSIQSSLHTSLVTIPRKLAFVIHRNPAWVSHAVEAFYLRDPIALKSLTRKDGGLSLVFAPEDLIDVPVKFNRVGFAQLQSQNFPFPPAWSTATIEVDASELDSEKLQQRAGNGMKLTCGFEMLVNDAASQGKQSVREILLILQDLAEGEEELPNNDEIARWRKDQREQDDMWLDIDFDEFDKNLSGKAEDSNSSGRTQASSSKESTNRPGDEKIASAAKRPAFADAETQANVERMVEQMQTFMKDQGSAEEIDDDENDGADTDSDGIEDDDDDDDAGDSDSDDDSEEAELDEAELQKMIAEMQAMGIKPPPATGDDAEGRELRAALLALSDMAVPASKGPGRESAKGFDWSGLADDPGEARDGSSKPKKNSMPVAPQGPPVEQDDSDEDDLDALGDDAGPESLDSLAAAMEAELKGHGMLGDDDDDNDFDAALGGTTVENEAMAARLLAALGGDASGPKRVDKGKGRA